MLFPSGKRLSATFPMKKVPHNIRQQQSKVSQYVCVASNCMNPLYLGLSVLDVDYNIIEKEDDLSTLRLR